VNLKPHLFDLLCKELVIQVDAFDPSSFIIIHSILKFFSYMESNIIKTYLLDYIFDILENQKFKSLVYPQAAEEPPRLLSSSSSAGRLAPAGASSIFMIHESFMVCISKVLNLLFMEKSLNSRKLYNEMFERLGEGIFCIVHRFLMIESRNSKGKESLAARGAKRPELFEQNYLI
jgi:hypothetical protein